MDNINPVLVLAPSKFLIDELEQIAKNACYRRQNPIPMKQLTQEQEHEFNNAVDCHICKQPFKKANKIIDWQGSQLGACHQECSPYPEEQR